LLLVFIGSKVFLADLFGWEDSRRLVSLGVTLGLIAAGVVLSLWKTRGELSVPATTEK
jgi:tellurite resistance protein TerC